MRFKNEIIKLCQQQLHYIPSKVKRLHYRTIFAEPACGERDTVVTISVRSMCAVR